MDKKGIAVFVGVTFGVGYALQLFMGWFGLIHLSEPNIFQRILLLGLMFVPALGALCAGKFSESAASPTIPRLWPIPKRSAIQAALSISGAFVVIHMILGLTGLQEPQWGMGTLMNNINAMLAELQQPPMSETVAAIAPFFLLVTGFVLSIALGVSIYAVAALGMEWAWRGFLLPRMMPLGKARAYVAVGLLSGLWFMPLIFLYRHEGNIYGSTFVTIFQFLAAAIVLGALSGEILQRTGNLGLSCIALGVFLGQSMGIWSDLFPVVASPWSGPLGVIALLVWSFLAWKSVLVTGPLPKAADNSASPAPVSTESV